jgi:hypothetical protein
MKFSVRKLVCRVHQRGYEQTFKQPGGFYLHDLPHVGLGGHNQLVIQYGFRWRLMIE